MKFSIIEKRDMIAVYSACDQNSVAAERLYAERFPDRIHPSRRTFQRLFKMLGETGSFNEQKRVRKKTVRTTSNTINVLAAVNNNPQSSTRQISRGMGISQSSVVRILQSQRFHPFHISLHQELHGTDFENRVQFCHWFLNEVEGNNTFVQNILFTDEATFTNCAQVNLRNMHYWSLENPRWLRQTDHQRRWNLNVWCGIIGNKIIGPHFIDGSLTGQKYSRFLSETLPVLLENVPYQTRLSMWYQHDGCPAHYARTARQQLQRQFPNRWIGRGGQISWPARSPDLTPLDYFLWGHLKENVYREPPTTIENMKQRIIQQCNTITEETLQHVSTTLLFRLRACIEHNGQHFGHFIK